MVWMNRRRLLAAGAAGMSLLGSGPLGAVGGEARSSLLFSAASLDRQDGSREHRLQALALSDERIEVRFSVKLPGRAHHVALSQEQGLFVAIARRPGRWLVVGDLASGAVLQTLRLPEGRHFQGHGIFAPDGRTFWTVESAYETAGDNGRIGYWDVDRNSEPVIRQRGLFESAGTGAHELKLMPDGRTLVIANGGIRTHPDQPREKLNLDVMQPSLVYLDTADGGLLEKVRMPAEWHQNSIRHLDIKADGEVAFATQYQGEPFDAVPLVALHRRGEALRFPAVGTEIQRQMKQYCGSVRFDASGRYLAVSCPRGNILTVWDVRNERLLESLRIRDVCGVSACGEAFFYTTGTGLVGLYDPLEQRSWIPGKASAYSWDDTLWDNHLSALENV